MIDLWNGNEVFINTEIEDFFRYNDDVIILDKTGRFQQFTLDGDFIRIAAQIDAYLGNGFVIINDQAVIACSGIVLNEVWTTAFTEQSFSL